MYILQSDRRSAEKVRTKQDWLQCFNLVLRCFVSVTYLEYVYKVV